MVVCIVWPHIPRLSWNAAIVCLCEVVTVVLLICVCRKLAINVSPCVCAGNEGYGSATSMERAFQEIAENVQHFCNNGTVMCVWGVGGGIVFLILDIATIYSCTC